MKLKILTESQTLPARLSASTKPQQRRRRDTNAECGSQSSPQVFPGEHEFRHIEIAIN
jgi:hypothetical protein